MVSTVASVMAVARKCDLIVLVDAFSVDGCARARLRRLSTTSSTWDDVKDAVFACAFGAGFGFAAGRGAGAAFGVAARR